MEGKLIWSIFWALVGAFVVIVCLFTIPAARELLMGSLFLITSGVVLFVLGGVLIFLTVRQKVGELSKTFLLFTGASALGIPVGAALHNLVYGLFIYWFGEGFWDRIGLGDEPVFLIMAIFICPLGFLVGAVGSIVLAVKKHGQRSAQP